MSEKRPDGYYWVNFRGFWSPCRCSMGMVFMSGVSLKESDFDEIGPPCNRDDSEQLAKAREVLRKVLATEMDAIAAWAIRDAFDKSGVRL